MLGFYWKKNKKSHGHRYIHKEKDGKREKEIVKI